MKMNGFHNFTGGHILRSIPRPTVQLGPRYQAIQSPAQSNGLTPVKNLNFKPRQKVMKTLYQRKFLIRFEGNLNNLYPFKSVDGERHKTNLLKLFVKKTGQVSAAPKPQFPSLTKPNYIIFITSTAMHCIFEIHFAINRLLKSV